VEDSVSDWYRGFYTGVKAFPEVRENEILLLTDVRPEQAVGLGVDFIWLKGEGLRPRAPQRGLAIVGREQASRLSAEQRVLVTTFEPLTHGLGKPK
jgi:hypothetical protein